MHEFLAYYWYRRSCCYSTFARNNYMHASVIIGRLMSGTSNDPRRQNTLQLLGIARDFAYQANRPALSRITRREVAWRHGAGDSRTLRRWRIKPAKDQCGHAGPQQLRDDETGCVAWANAGKCVRGTTRQRHCRVGKRCRGREPVSRRDIRGNRKRRHARPAARARNDHCD